ncbi:polyadenylate-binding protein-interacting protein 12-like isoform X2 [Silene latifolia]|uniref:polyadenylate-binding protein-interacting protein 12-like isoform X2 n=1 Tax=Silene latifolia TaxID=37657 RepID=UPI003D76E68A
MAIMAVAENGVASTEQHFETTDLDRSNGNGHGIGNGNGNGNINGEKIVVKDQNLSLKTLNNNGVNGDVVVEEKSDGIDVIKEKINNNDNHVLTENGVINNVKKADSFDDDDDVDVEKVRGETMEKDGGEGFKEEIRDLEEKLSKLNPMAKEFLPPSLSNNGSMNGFGYVNNYVIQPNVNVAGNVNGYTGRRKKNGYGNGKRRMNSRTSMAQREEIIRRTVYVSDIDQQVTEEQLASLFINCGQVVDCRVCGDPNSVLRFAFVEFTNEEAAKNALILSGTMLGFYPVRVLPSKTAIAPVNPTFLPRSEDEREMCARTVYCTNIDKKITQADLKLFFETFCGEVYRLRMLGDYHHSTRIAFVEFVMAESAISALNCSGAVLGTLPIRVSPSKTPVRPRATPRSPSQ